MTLAERWQKMSFKDRIRAIASEVGRAEIWENKDEDLYRFALEKGLELIELSLDNPTSREEIYPMLILQERLAEFYIGQRKGVEELSAVF